MVPRNDEEREEQSAEEIQDDTVGGGGLHHHQHDLHSTGTVTTPSIADTGGVEHRSESHIEQVRIDVPVVAIRQSMAGRITMITGIPGAFEVNGPGVDIVAPTPHQENEVDLHARAENERVSLGGHSQLEASRSTYAMNIAEEELAYLIMQLQQRKRRNHHIICACIVGLIIVIITIVLVLIFGIDTRRNDGSEESTATEWSKCLVIEDQESKRYRNMRAMIISKNPDMEASFVTFDSCARKALCWLVYGDALNIEVKGEYQAVQRFTLALLYFHFVTDRGKTRTSLLESNWLMPVHECEWDYLECKGGDKAVVTDIFLLNSQQLNGGIPPELALLTRLTSLQLPPLYLRGSIPTELWTMIQLEVINVVYPYLTGTFPNEVTHLTRLRHLELESSFSTTTGTLPPNMSVLTDLEALSFRGLSTAGSVPNISGCTNLASLDLERVTLTGSMPTNIGSLSKLTALTIATESISGTLPTELGSLLNLEILNIRGAKFSGTIPSELGNLANLEMLNFERLRLITGSIPSELGRLLNLEFFGLSTASITGTMPSEICLLQQSNSLTIFTGAFEAKCD